MRKRTVGSWVVAAAVVIGGLSFSVPAGAEGGLTLEERVKWVADRFQKNKASRPTRKKSLLTTIHAFCRKELSAVEVQQIVKAMVAGKMIEVPAKGDVVYHF